MVQGLRIEANTEVRWAAEELPGKAWGLVVYIDGEKYKVCRLRLESAADAVVLLERGFA